MPVITPRHGITFAHPLLYHRPMAFVAEYEVVHIQLKPVLNGRVIHLRAELTASHQLIPIQAGAFTDTADLFRCLPGEFSFSSADINAQLPGMWIDRPFQSSHYRSSDAG